MTVVEQWIISVSFCCSKCILSHQLLSGIRERETKGVDRVNGRDKEVTAHLGSTHGSRAGAGLLRNNELLLCNISALHNFRQ